MEKIYTCPNSSEETNELSVLQTDGLAISRWDWEIFSLIDSLSSPVNMI